MFKCGHGLDTAVILRQDIFDMQNGTIFTALDPSTPPVSVVPRLEAQTALAPAPSSSPASLRPAQLRGTAVPAVAAESAQWIVVGKGKKRNSKTRPAISPSSSRESSASTSPHPEVGSSYRTARDRRRTLPHAKRRAWGVPPPTNPRVGRVTSTVTLVPPAGSSPNGAAADPSPTPASLAPPPSTPPPPGDHPRLYTAPDSDPSSDPPAARLRGGGGGEPPSPPSPPPDALANGPPLSSTPGSAFSSGADRQRRTASLPPPAPPPSTHRTPSYRDAAAGSLPAGHVATPPGTARPAVGGASQGRRARSALRSRPPPAGAPLGLVGTPLDPAVQQRQRRRPALNTPVRTIPKTPTPWPVVGCIDVWASVNLVASHLRTAHTAPQGFPEYSSHDIDNLAHAIGPCPRCQHAYVHGSIGLHVGSHTCNRGAAALRLRGVGAGPGPAVGALPGRPPQTLIDPVRPHLLLPSPSQILSLHLSPLLLLPPRPVPSSLPSPLVGAAVVVVVVVVVAVAAVVVVVVVAVVVAVVAVAVAPLLSPASPSPPSPTANGPFTAPPGSGPSLSPTSPASRTPPFARGPLTWWPLSWATPSPSP